MTSGLGSKQPGYWIYHTLWTAIDWVYPPVCGGCLRSGERWCEDCQSKVERLTHELCPICGVPEPGGVLCPSCGVHPPPFRAIRSWGRYTGTLREAIHRLKYNHDIGIAEALSNHLIELLCLLIWPIDVITVVPLGARRLEERGYNQSNLLARPVSLATGIPLRANALARTRETPSQVGLSAHDRRENMRDAFIARPDQVTGKTVLVIDDVATTGSTLTACTQALLAAGASAVYGLTLARAVLEPVSITAPTPSVGADTHPIQ